MEGGGGFHHGGVGGSSNVSSHNRRSVAETGALVVSRFGHQFLALVFNTDIGEGTVVRLAVDTGGFVGAVWTVKIVRCLPTVPAKGRGYCAPLR